MLTFGNPDPEDMKIDVCAFRCDITTTIFSFINNDHNDDFLIFYILKIKCGYLQFLVYNDNDKTTTFFLFFILKTIQDYKRKVKNVIFILFII